MKVLVACKRGNIGPRDKHGHCRCDACKAYNYARQRAQRAASGYRQRWNAANRDKLCQYQSRWVAKHPENRKQVVQSWRDRNPDKVAAMNARAGAKWARNNRGKRNAICRTRVHRKRLRTPKWADLSAIEAFYLEAQRLTDATGVPHEVDHIVPLFGKTASGLHVHTNLQVIPRSMNRRKGNRIGGVQSAS